MNLDMFLMPSVILARISVIENYDLSEVRKYKEEYMNLKKNTEFKLNQAMMVNHANSIKELSMLLMVYKIHLRAIMDREQMLESKEFDVF